MSIPTHVFREYDIRGLTSNELTPEFAEALGRGFGSYLLEKSPGAESVVLGRDHRMSSPALARGFSRGVRATGVDVCSIGIVPTPLTYFAANTLPVDGLCMITGSHNPPDYNGFKVGIGKSTLAGSEIQELKERVLHPQARGAARDGVEWEFDVVTPYLHFVTQSLGKAARKRHRRDRRAAAAPRAGPPGDRAVLRAGRQFPQPPPRPDRSGKPPRPPR